MPARCAHLDVNQVFATLGLLEWKPLVATLLLPPVPWLVMLLLAWWWQRRRPGWATFLQLTAVLGLWFSHCQVTGGLLERQLTVAPTLSTQRLAELRRSLPDGKTAIVVLGGGARELAPEYGESHLSPHSAERLHYAMWLTRQLPVPLLFSGGNGWGHPDGPAEAALAARMAQRDYGRPLRWQETQSHDTRDNARFSLPLLQKDGITQVVLVTHGWHMRRALRAFADEAARNGMALKLVPAPMGLVADRHVPTLQRWAPSNDGNQRVRQALREWIGLAAGA